MRQLHSRAFTLIELLVVIAIIGILTSLILAGVHRAKMQAHRVACTNGQIQIQSVWTQYAGDNDDRLVVNSNPLGNISPPTTNTPWASGGVHQFYATVTNEVFLTDPGYSAFAYARINPRLYRCPAVKHNIQGVSMIRHYSMNPFMGLRQGRSFGAPGGFESYQRMHDISQPSERLVFAEMNPYIICTTAIRINAMTADATGLIDSGDFATLPGFPHGKSTIVSYADGHVESQKMLTSAMDRVWPVPWIADHQGLHASDNADFLWFANRMTRAR
ncbi:MAG: type II secretion system protein [Verrucomicrobia bacterium]|nr:type II secretion system protein [Verrucomicrobiota bacterium]